MFEKQEEAARKGFGHLRNKEQTAAKELEYLGNMNKLLKGARVKERAARNELEHMIGRSKLLERDRSVCTTTASRSKGI